MKFGAIGKKFSIKLAAVIVLTLGVLAIIYFTQDPYNPPTGGETFEKTGALYVLASKDWPIERGNHIRDLTEEETEAFRHFLEEADYIKSDSFKDQVDMPVVRVDGIYWFVYRGGMFRKDGGESQWRKQIDGVRLTKDKRLDIDALIAWYRDQSPD